MADFYDKIDVGIREFEQVFAELVDLQAKLDEEFKKDPYERIVIVGSGRGRGGVKDAHKNEPTCLGCAVGTKVRGRGLRLAI